MTVEILDALGATDELFIVDLDHADVLSDADAAGRIEFRRGELSLGAITSPAAAVYCTGEPNCQGCASQMHVAG